MSCSTNVAKGHSRLRSLSNSSFEEVNHMENNYPGSINTYSNNNNNNNNNNNESNRRKSDDDDEMEFSPATIKTGEGNTYIGVLCQFFHWARLELTAFFLLIVFGTILGLVIPPNDGLTYPYNYYSNIMGWVYFCAWSISFYPQLIENYLRKSAIGLSMDFEMLNLLGFTCYSLFTLVNHYIFHTTVVTVQDTFFALHAVVITIITIGQMIYYDGWKPHRISYFIGVILTLMILSISIYAIIVLAYTSKSNSNSNNSSDNSHLWNWSQWLIFVSYIKLAISTIKGMPQVYLNCKRKSTEGWSIHNIICDFTGGLLSLLQLLLDCSNLHDWTQITKDPAKFGLGLVTMIFDIIFFIQHFILYPRSKHDMEYRRLLVNNSEE